MNRFPCGLLASRLPRRARLRRRVDRGAGSVLAVTLMAAVIGVTSLTLPLYTVFRARLQAEGAADAAALAAAEVAAGVAPGVPCDLAEELAAANGARLADCEVDGLVVAVRVHITLFATVIDAVARAGPSGQ